MNCKVAKLCGGCSYLNMPDFKAAKQKQVQVQEVMDKAGLRVKVDPVILAQNSMGYRNKVIVGFAKDRDKKIYSGLYAPRSHKVIDSQGCPMHENLLNEIIAEITKLVNSMHYELYNERTGTGLLRHVLLRYAKDTNEVMVVFVTSQPQFPSRRNLVNALVAKFPQIKTIVQSVNARQTSVVMENESQILYGKGMITDNLCGLKISFTAGSFYQINHDQCEKLYELAKKVLNPQKTDKVLDTYCGVGSIGLVMADSVKEVTGVEINKEAVKCAQFNAKQNGIENIRFVPMDSTYFMKEARKFDTHFDCIILDPPRAGTTEEFIEAACSLRPKKILYISCDPNTQARDLIRFKRGGYYTNEIHLVDMFPHTEHVESICLLTPSKNAPKKFEKKGPSKGVQKPKKDLNPYEKALLELKQSKKNKKK